MKRSYRKSVKIKANEIKEIQTNLIKPNRSFKTLNEYLNPVPHFIHPVNKPIRILSDDSLITQSSIVIITHLFYHHIALDYFDKLKQLRNELSFDLYVTISKKSDCDNTDVISKFKELTDNISIVPNIGKDIIPKIITIEKIIESNKKYDYCFLLHDKKDPNWRNSLIQPLFNKMVRNFSIYTMSHDIDVGGVGSKINLMFGPGWHKDMLMKRYKAEQSLLYFQETIRTRLQIKRKITQTWFIGGSMFWFKWEIFKDFYNLYGFKHFYDFTVNDIGDVKDPSYTHTIERFFGHIISLSDKKLIGV